MAWPQEQRTFTFSSVSLSNVHTKTPKVLISSLQRPHSRMSNKAKPGKQPFLGAHKTRLQSVCLSVSEVGQPVTSSGSWPLQDYILPGKTTSRILVPPTPFSFPQAQGTRIGVPTQEHTLVSLVLFLSSSQLSFFTGQ